MSEISGVDGDKERIQPERCAGRREDPARARGEARREDEEDGDIEDGWCVKRRRENTAAGGEEQHAQGIGGGRHSPVGRDFRARERRPGREEQPQSSRRNREHGAWDPS
jgi:hypothetical protein